MPDDFDAEVANRFKVFDDVPVPDTWSRVQFKVLDRMPVEFTEEGATMIDLALRSRPTTASSGRSGSCCRPRPPRPP